MQQIFTKNDYTRHDDGLSIEDYFRVVYHCIAP